MIDYHFDLEQGTPEWLALRAPLLTASNFAAGIGNGAGRKTLLYKTAAAIITGEVPESFSNAAMDWGNEQESFARAAYEFATGNTVVESGIVTNTANPGVGASVDGLVGDDGLTEYKCPNSSTQIETVLSGKMPTKHRAQVQGQLFVCERMWCDFVSYDPRIPSDKSLFIVRVDRDDKYINETLAPGIDRFVTDLNAIVERMK